MVDEKSDEYHKKHSQLINTSLNIKKLNCRMRHNKMLSVFHD